MSSLPCFFSGSGDPVLSLYNLNQIESKKNAKMVELISFRAESLHRGRKAGKVLVRILGLLPENCHFCLHIQLLLRPQLAITLPDHFVDKLSVEAEHIKSRAQLRLCFLLS